MAYFKKLLNERGEGREAIAITKLQSNQPTVNFKIVMTFYFFSALEKMHSNFRGAKYVGIGRQKIPVGMKTPTSQRAVRRLPKRKFIQNNFDLIIDSNYPLPIANSIPYCTEEWYWGMHLHSGGLTRGFIIAY